jgi:hypothetical protein
VGQDGGLAAGALSISGGARIVFYYPDHRNGALLDRHACDYQFLQGGKDPHERHGAGLQKIIDIRTEPWGINVISVEVKDVLIPAALEDAMSMQAQAERERQARVILGDSEKQVAEKFAEAARTYVNDPVALHLRAMNMLYEGLKQNSTIVIVPSSAVETMQLGGLAGLTALTMGLGQDRAAQAKVIAQPAPQTGPDAVEAVVTQ